MATQKDTDPKADTKAKDDAKATDSADTTTDTSIAQPVDPNLPFTVEGKDGIERMVSAPSDGWEPAQVEPTEAEIKAAEEREQAQKDAREARLATVEDRTSDDSKDEKTTKDKG